VFIFAAVKGAGMRFSVYLRWHNNPVGIGMQDKFCCRGKKRPTAHGADDHRAATAGFGKKSGLGKSSTVLHTAFGIIVAGPWGILVFNGV
jgi:hypothetical protein